MNGVIFLILLTYTWTSCVSQCTRIIVHDWGTLRDRSDPITRIAGSAPNGIKACCLEHVSDPLPNGLQIGLYRILYRQSEKFEYNIARIHLQTVLDRLSRTEEHCLHNAYWLE
ncbi:hypothetical protein P879_04568 [Paragonimus westermani]|uniref:Uncharacterized protein n=1 Tax=Paragonimus westermani TaxID=34504 RepID=A0A8T0DTJ8_9TREM|nr:hypothetical protein P879_04568 [Paragonimus westermani]